MASPHALPPQVGDSTNLLLKKLVTATQALAASGGVFLTVAEGDALYLKQLSNLSDLTNVATARTNLGLGTASSATFANVTDSALTAGRVTFAGVAGLLSDNAAFLFNSGTGALTATSYSLGLTTPGTISGSIGAITLAAAGTNQNVTITPSGTGSLLVARAGAPSVTSASTAQLLSLYGSSGVAVALTRSSADSSGSTISFFKDRAGGTNAAVQSGDEIAYFDFRASYGTGLYNRAALIYATVDAAPGPTWIPGNLQFWTTSTAGASAARMVLNNYGRVSLTPGTGTLAAWGVTGAVCNVGANAITDSTSSGTVATAVANSFAVPTFAASSATTFTNAANLYIAGDVANGTNVTLTNSYGLWNVGKTRLDGAVIQNAKTTTYNSVATAGEGLVNIRAQANITAQSANATITSYANPAADADYEVSAQMSVTASTTLVTTLTVTYTDVANVARTMILPVVTTTGTYVAAGAITGAGASIWHASVTHIRAKASTTITVLTSAGTFTGVTYSASAVIKKTS